MRRSLVLALTALLGSAGLIAAGSSAATADDAAPVVSPSPVTYFVDCSAATDGDGVTTSWNSLRDVDAHGAFLPGDHLLFKRGATCKGQLIPRGDGSPAAPIVVDVYGSGSKPAVIAGGGTPSGTGTVMLNSQHDIVVQHLTITNHAPSTTTGYRSGVLVADVGAGQLAGVALRGLHITDVVSDPASSSRGGSRSYGGISVLSYGLKNDGFVGLQITGNTIDHVSRTGIFVSNFDYQAATGPKGADHGGRISGNTVRSVRGDGIVLEGSIGGRIDHNLVAHAAQLYPCKQCGPKGPETASAAIWTSYSSGVRIDHNEAYGTSATGGDGEGFDLDIETHNAVLEDNYSHDNEGGGILVCSAQNSTVRFNVIQNNNRAQLVFTCAKPAKNVSYLNNDIYVKSPSTAAYMVRTGRGKGAKGISFRNNLVWTQGKSIWQWPGAVSASNNTVIGFHSSTEPRGSSHSAPAIRHPGAGKTGFASLSAYRWKNAKHPQRGGAVPKGLTDALGVAVNAKHPARGAISG